MISSDSGPLGSSEPRETGQGGLLKLADGTDTLQALRDAGLRVIGDPPQGQKPDEGRFRGSFRPY